MKNSLATFQNLGVPSNYWVCEEEMKRQIFGLMCRGGRLWLFAGSCCSFPGSLQSFVGGL